MIKPAISLGKKTVVAMVHLPALPGSPDYDTEAGMSKILDTVLKDLEALQSGGVDAVMFGNEFDRPYVLKAPPEGLAAIAAIIGQVKSMIKVPFGVNYLWDPLATVALAVATEADFAREIYTGLYASDMGLWAPDCAGAARLRSSCGRSDLQMLFNINAEFSTSLDERTLAAKAKSVVFSSKADVICVSGMMTGMSVDQAELRKVRESIPEIPLLANTGVTIDSVEEIFSFTDGCVIGSHLKQNGYTWNTVDPERVHRFMEKVNEIR